MDIEAIGSIPSPRHPGQPGGVSSDLAEARARLREATPSGHWEAVLAEVRRLQVDESMAPLTALRSVYARLAAGWVPPVTR